MNETPHFQPSEWDSVGEIYVSPEKPFGRLDEYLYGLYEELFEVRTAVRFYQIVSELVFHARHLTPAQHSLLGFVLQSPFRPRRDKPQNPERDAEMRQAVRPAGSLLSWRHPLSGLKGKALIEAVMKHWGLGDEAAKAAIKKARREVKAGKI